MSKIDVWLFQAWVKTLDMALSPSCQLNVLHDNDLASITQKNNIDLGNSRAIRWKEPETLGDHMQQDHSTALDHYQGNKLP